MSRIRRNALLILEALAILVCLGMMLVVRGHADETHADVAVLKSRADSIDRHLEHTDGNIAQIQETLKSQGEHVSAMEAREYTAWSILCLLGTGGIVVRISGKKGT